LKILVISGPNLNMLGKRDVAHYGARTLDQIHQSLKDLGTELGAAITCYQSNHEGAIIDQIQDATKSGVQGIVINPGAYGHTSIALRDALLDAALPFVEVHLSNIHKRESFRQKSYISDIANGVVLGFGPESYMLGLRALVNTLGALNS
jgi:3-dehydroquinate dehydratase II